VARNERFEGGDLVVQSLQALGVKHLFSVSGGPINSVYRAADRYGLPLIHTRHEAAACFMAEAAARVTRHAGAAIVTLGPGVTNCATPALVARLGGTPLLIIGAQTAVANFGRGAGMAFETLPVMAPLVKWSAQVHDTARLPEYIAVAWRQMWAGRPGPVYLEVPVDVLAGPASAQDALPFVRSRSGIAAHDAAALQSDLAKAKRPVVILGDEVFWDPPDDLRDFVEKWGAPFVTARLARGAIDEAHPLWAGPGYTPCNATLAKGLAEADLVVLLGHDFEFDLGFGDGLGQNTKVVQVASDATVLNRNRVADLPVAASPREALAAIGPFQSAVDAAWTRRLTTGWVSERQQQLGENEDGRLHPVAAIDAVIAACPRETIFVSSHGNVDFWADARLIVHQAGSYLRAGQSGALGAELPYGVGAAFAAPDRPVVVFVGDGGVGFAISELDTAARHGRKLIVVVLDDEKWGAIALPQQLSYGADFAMDIPRRDWALVAKGLGGDGLQARTVHEIGEAMRQALAGNGPALVQIPIASKISPYMAAISG
jgi:acetolactate synthase-1/2/3 large subunit